MVCVISQTWLQSVCAFGRLYRWGHGVVPPVWWEMLVSSRTTCILEVQCVSACDMYLYLNDVILAG